VTEAIKKMICAVCVTVLAGGLFANAALAEVQFKRVKPPAAGTKKRITIQVTAPWPPPLIKKKKETAPDVTTTAPKAPRSGETEHAWFWDVISPALESADPERIETALAHVNASPTGTSAYGISRSRMEKTAATHGLSILKATLGKSISPAFVLALIEVESGGKVLAKSNKGAQGLMQLIPDTAKRFGVTDASDPVQNITGGVKYLDWLLNKFKGDPLLALAGYNAGENAVLKNEGIPPYVETRAYVPKIVTAWGIARQFCITPPRQVRDGCVLRSELMVKK